MVRLVLGHVKKWGLAPAQTPVATRKRVTPRCLSPCLHKHLRFGALLCIGFGLSACGSNERNAAENAQQAQVKTYKATHARVRTIGRTRNPRSIVKVVTADKTETLDPHNTESGGDVKLINQIYETLVRIDPNDVDRLIPALAKSWSVAPDGLSLTFAMRDGTVFHDGSPLDARAAKLSLDRLCGVYLDVPAAPYRGFYDFLKEIEADGMTLTVHLTRPVVRIALRNLSMFAASIISPRLLETTKDMSTNERSHFISQWASGTGSYFLSKFAPAEARVRLHRFSEYWNGPPQVETILFRQVADPNSQVEYLRSGEADMLDDVPRPVWDQFEADPNVKLKRWWALNLCYLAVNVRHEKTRHIDVRRAIQLAIDRTALKKLYYGSARETYSLIAQPFGEYNPNYRPPGTDRRIEQRHTEARRLLAERGLASSHRLKIFYPMHPRPYLPTPEKVADKLRQQLEQVSLEVEIVAVPNKELFESIRHDQYELVLIGWMSDNADPDNFYIPLASGDAKTQTPAPTNCGRAFDAQVHDLLIRAQAVTDAQQRIDLYRQVERRLQEQILGYVPLLNTQQACAFRSHLQGVEVDPLGHYRFDDAMLVPLSTNPTTHVPKNDE